MVAAEGRAAGGDGGGDPGEMAGHDVGVALDDHGPAGLRDVLLRQVDAVQHLGLLVDRGLGGVEVLRAVVVVAELAGAEADDVAGGVADRPHQPAAEAVDGAAPAVLGEAGGDQLLVAEALAAEVTGEVVPARRAVADAEVGGGGLVEAALGEELPADLGLGAVQLLGVELGGRLVCLDQPDALAALVGGVVPALLVAQGDARLGGEPLDDLRERQMVDLLHEGDRVAALLAAEAVEETLARADLEGGDFSSWNGQRPLRLPPPALRSWRYSETTASIGTASRTAFTSSSLILPATGEVYGWGTTAVPRAEVIRGTRGLSPGTPAVRTGPPARPGRAAGRTGSAPARSR